MYKVTTIHSGVSKPTMTKEGGWIWQQYLRQI